MITKFKNFCKFASTNGLYLPAAYDKGSDGPSVSLWFAHISFIIASIGVIVLMFNDLNKGVYSAIGLTTLMLSFYLLRALQKVKFGRDGIELEGEDETPQATTTVKTETTVETETN